MRLTAWLSVAILAALLAGCNKSDHATKPLPPISIESGDVCHVCGMYITPFPGPKGEAYVRGANKPFKFCSTRDLFSWLLQPENKIAATSVYVHDMGKTSWTHPSDSDFVAARTAWYVVDQPLPGAMGPTLASFAKRADAESFIKKHGGHLLRFEDITLELLANLKGGADLSGKPVPAPSNLNGK
jgi:copper chaperone NosL